MGNNVNKALEYAKNGNIRDLEKAIQRNPNLINQKGEVSIYIYIYIYIIVITIIIITI